MDNKALAETYVDLWCYIDGNLIKRGIDTSVTEIPNMIFEQTCKRIISDLIGKQRQGVPARPEGRSEEKPTDKQLMLAEKLGCKNASHFTRKDLSAWIEENKNW